MRMILPAGVGDLRGQPQNSFGKIAVGGVVRRAATVYRSERAGRRPGDAHAGARKAGFLGAIGFC